VLPGVEGEGLLIEPKGKVHGHVVLIPDAGQLPESLVGLGPTGEQESHLGLILSDCGFRVVIPTLIDRESEFSKNDKLNRKTNIPHREFIYRMAYEMGRTLIGYEVQKVLALVDWFTSLNQEIPIGVMGIGQGGQIAFYSGAVDERIAITNVCLYFGERQRVWEEPIDRNLWGQLREFGDAEIAQLILPRKLLVDPKPSEREKRLYADRYWRKWDGPCPTKQVGQAAIGRIGSLAVEGIPREWKRILSLKRILSDEPQEAERETTEDYNWPDFQQQFFKEQQPVQELKQFEIRTLPKGFDPNQRQKRQFEQLVSYTQKLWRDSDAVREKRFAKCDPASPEKWDKSCDDIRNYFWEEVIGKLPEPTIPVNPKSRLIYEEPKWKGYEITLDLYPDVFSYGILLVPNDVKEGEKRPVVVCQHGLEGRPTDICNPKEKTKYYNSFGAQLADRGYIVFAPQNPYIFRDQFRQLQRKANPLKLSLFSFIVRQHERILNWLETLPFVDGERMAFYGLSYGGKTAMRVPAILKKYCLSICSGDFNEWIGKNVSIDYKGSYMWTIEYEMYEFDLGSTFNYAEMAYLIAPRPFMVERGHDDGVGIDEMVASEFAKVRYLYANRLKLPRHAEIEFFVGGHEINGKGTFEFLDRHLRPIQR
jgi:cephalosporin-C deacetylase-like acetyl esterase